MPFHYFLGLRSRLMLLVLSAVVPALLLILYSSIEQRRDAAAYAENAQLNTAKSVAEGHRAVLVKVRQLLVSLSTMAEVPDDAAASKSCSKMLSTILPYSQEILNVGVAHMNGNVVCSSLAQVRPVNVADRSFFQSAIASRDFSVGNFVVNRISGKRGIAFSYPLLNADQQMWGVAFVVLDLAWLNQRLSEMPNLSGQEVLEIVDSAGTILERHPDPGQYVGVSMESLPLFRRMVELHGEGTFDSVGLDGVRRIYAFAPLFGKTACCAYSLVGVPADVVYADASRTFVRNVSLMGGVAFLVLVMAWIGSEFLVLRRIRVLTSAARRMGERDLSARSGLPHGTEELGQLARSFDEMADKLESWHERVIKATLAVEKMSYHNQLILDSVGEGIYGVDMAGRFAFINPAGAEMLGYSIEELIGKSLHETVHYNKPDGSPYPSGECPHLRALTAGEALRGSDEMVWRKDGSGIYVDYSITPIAEGERMSGSVVTFKDITERKRHEEQLVYQATHDTLTGLANRTILSDRLALLIERASRTQTVVGLLLLDLDRFKGINDSLGHGAGDELLRCVANRLTGLVRESDTVARLGGDEFVILSEMKEAGNVITVARKILVEMAKPFALSDREVFVSASIGISLYPKDGSSGETLMRNADTAMYSAKKHGRNTFRFYAESMNVSTVERLNMESKLRRAVDNGELLLHYQPQVNLHSGEIIGAEALIRWNHPELGMIHPDKFISLAEETGLIFPISDWVLHTACAQMKKWQAAALPELKVAVNVSAHQFRRQNLLKLTAGALLKTGLDGRFLELEMTESAVMEDVERVARILQNLKGETNVEISIDDFGTGYSSLSYLKQFAIDKLKVDQSFVRDITRDPNDAAITLAVITMAHSLGMTVIAEGVETPGQMEFLRSHGCDEMQGYYFSRPVPAEDLEEMLREGITLKPSGESAQGPERTLLLVDDEANVTAALKRLFQHQGYHVLVAGSASEGLEFLAVNKVGVILTDQNMPQISGIEFLNRVKQLYPDPVRIVLSAYSDLKLVNEAFRRGAIYKYINKPWGEEELLHTVQEAFRQYELQRASNAIPAGLR